MKFKHVSGAHVSREAVQRIEFPEIEGCPWLEVRPAGESNRAYTAAALRQPDRNNLITRDRMSPEDIERERASSIVLYAKHILTGNGGGWIDEESGAEVAMPLSEPDREALLKQLPPDLYDRMRIFCNRLSNFRS